MVGQLPHRPVTGRILGKRQPDQRCALVIQGDRPDLPPVLVPGADVHVPQRCLTQRPAIPRFLAHPLDDLVSEVTGVELSDGGHDAVEQHPTRRLVDVLAGRYQPDAGLLKRPVYLHIVSPVAGQAIQLMDDDVVDPTIFLEVGQHLLQLRAVSATSRLAPVGELLDHQRTHRLSLALVGLTLSRQGEALLATTALGLLAGGDADVGDGAFESELRSHGRKRVSSDCRCTALC